MNMLHQQQEIAQQSVGELSPYERELSMLLAGDHLGALALQEVLPYPEQATSAQSETNPAPNTMSLRELEEAAMVHKNTAGEATRRAVEDSPEDPEKLADRIELLVVFHALKHTHDPATSIAAARELTLAAEELRSGYDLAG